MQLMSILTALALTFIPGPTLAVPSTKSISPRAATPFTLVIQGNKSQLGGLNNLPVDGSYTSKGKQSPLLAATGTAQPTGTEFTLTKGSLHWKVFKKSYSTKNIFYGEPIVGVPGKGANEYLIINATSGYLSFKPMAMGSSQYDFRLCHLKSPPGTYKYAVALGDVDGHKCYAVFLKAKF